MWFHDLLGNYCCVFILNIRFLAHNFDSTSTSLIWRFDYPQLTWILLFELVDFKFVVVCRQNLGCRNILKFFGVFALEIKLVPLHVIFTAQLETIRKVVYALLEVEVANKLGFAGRKPECVKLLVFAFLKAGFLKVWHHTILPVGVLHLKLQCYFIILFHFYSSVSTVFVDKNVFGVVEKDCSWSILENTL